MQNNKCSKRQPITLQKLLLKSSLIKLYKIHLSSGMGFFLLPPAIFSPRGSWSRLFLLLLKYTGCQKKVF
ncbi:hypothetical protein BpHYR1_025597 [Brachionus plicatilis]|uniref:Uncharacterized protein n=1 Tax=Brachionus plicatilis TaxID=10195 RepID=A0A3M7QFF5_BRAPC|nr:hypothetical protein BpHYR1_025597 [Brachionus plicatilis]